MTHVEEMPTPTPAPATFDFSFEVIIDLPVTSMAARMKTMLEAHGWKIGHTTETPHRGQLVVAGRERSRSYALRNYLPYWDHDWVEAIASDHEGQVAIVNEPSFSEWTRGKETIRLDGEHNGNFRGVEWWDIQEGQAAAPKELPSTFVAALRQPHSPGDLTGQLATALYGKPNPEGDETALDFFHPFDATLKSSLEPLFVVIREKVAQGQAVRIPGFATFEPRRLSDRVFPTADSDAFQSCFTGAATSPITLKRDLLHDWSSEQIATLQSKLQSVCTRIRDGKTDVLLGAGLAIGSLDFPEYDGRNPRTGKVVKVPAKRVPYFVGW